MKVKEKSDKRGKRKIKIYRNADKMKNNVENIIEKKEYLRKEIIRKKEEYKKN